MTIQQWKIGPIIGHINGHVWREYTTSGGYQIILCQYCSIMKKVRKNATYKECIGKIRIGERYTGDYK